MRAAAILSEAWRNIATRTTRATTFSLLLGLSAAAAGLLDTTTIISIQQDAEDWRTSGAAIHVLSVDQGIDGRSCTTLTHARGATGQPIAAAGALTAGPVLTFEATPASSLPSFTVTPSLADVLGIGSRVTDGVWISDQLADTLAADAGDHLDTDHGPLTIAAIFTWPDDGRDQRLAYAVLVPSATQTRYDECWATITPSNPAASDLLRSAGIVTSQSTNAPPIALVNNTLGQDDDAQAQYEDRTSRYAGPLIPLIGLGLGYIATRLRRLEYASARHAGLRPRALSLTAAIETLAWAVPAIAAAAGVIVLTVSRLTDPENAVDLLVGQIPALLAVIVTSQIGVLAALALTHERHLFAYFKDR